MTLHDTATTGIETLQEAIAIAVRRYEQSKEVQHIYKNVDDEYLVGPSNTAIVAEYTYYPVRMMYYVMSYPE